MTLAELKRLVAKGESDRLEFKRTTGTRTEAAKTVCAMLNGLGGFHFGIEPSKLTIPHESKPWNPIIANVFCRAGVIERWGMGTLKILDWCQEFECPAPEWKEQADSVYITFKPAAWFEKERATTQVAPEVAPEVTPEVTPEVARLLPACTQPTARGALQERLRLRDDEHFRKAYLLPALAAGVIERTIPDKPRSRFQRYRLTEKGRAVLQGLKPDE